MVVTVFGDEELSGDLTMTTRRRLHAQSLFVSQPARPRQKRAISAPIESTRCGAPSPPTTAPRAAPMT